MSYQDTPAVREAIARITAADDIHYSPENWFNYPNAARIIESDNRAAMTELKRRTEKSANGYFRSMDEATLLSAPTDHEALQDWLQARCDAAIARVDINQIAANVAKRYSI